MNFRRIRIELESVRTSDGGIFLSDGEKNRSDRRNGGGGGGALASALLSRRDKQWRWALRFAALGWRLAASSLAQVYRQGISKGGETWGAGKHKRERNGEHGNWRPLKASRGGVYLRRSERSDKWRGDAFVEHRRLCGWLTLPSSLSSAPFPCTLLPLCRVFSAAAISQDLICHR